MTVAAMSAACNPLDEGLFGGDERNLEHAVGTEHMNIGKPADTGLQRRIEQIGIGLIVDVAIAEPVLLAGDPEARDDEIGPPRVRR